MSKIALLNTTIVTTDGEFSVKTISAEEARALISGKETVSHVGHESACQAMSEILGIDVPFNRAPYTQGVGDVALCFKLNGRAPEGAILSREQLDEMGFVFKKMVRNSLSLPDADRVTNSGPARVELCAYGAWCSVLAER